MKALFDKFGDVAIDGVKRDASHRYLLAAFAMRARSQRDIQLARRQLGILIKHFVKVTHTKHQDTVWILALDVEILPPHGCDARHVVTLEHGCS